MTLIDYHADDGHRIGFIAKHGHKYLALILMSARGIKVTRVPIAEERYMSPMPDACIAKAKKQFRAAWKKFGGTKEARRYLRGN